MNQKNQKITIHIGMPKSASTTLQKNFFSQLPFINYGGVEKHNKIAKFLFQIIHKEISTYNQNNIRTEIFNHIENDLPSVLSSELACSILVPYSRIIPQPKQIIANRLKKIFPDAQILIIIRNQFSLQQSLFNQLIKTDNDFFSPNNLKFNDWINLNIELSEKGVPNVFSFADYYPLLNIYTELFNEVKVVVFEEMIKNLDGFIKKELCPFIGVDPKEAMPYFNNIKENKRHTKGSLLAEKQIDNTISVLNNLGNPQKIIPIEKRRSIMKRIRRKANRISIGKIDTTYTREQIQFINDYYAEGNRKVSILIEKNIENYGYPI